MENIRELIKYSGFLGGSAGSGGAQPDLNAAPGEPGHVLNRTHWVESGETVILPETTVVIDPDAGNGVLAEPMLNLKDGNEYTVMWNGTEYKCTALYLEMDGEGGSVLGNFDLMSGTGDSGEPFIIIAYNPETAATIGASLIIQPLDGSESATVSIRGMDEIVHKLDSKFIDMPATTIFVPVSYDPTNNIVSERVTCNKTYAWIREKVEKGHPVVLTVEMHGGNGFCYAYLVGCFSAEMMFATPGASSLRFDIRSNNTWHVQES